MASTQTVQGQIAARFLQMIDGKFQGRRAAWFPCGAAGVGCMDSRYRHQWVTGFVKESLRVLWLEQGDLRDVIEIE